MDKSEFMPAFETMLKFYDRKSTEQFLDHHYSAFSKDPIGVYWKRVKACMDTERFFPTVEQLRGKGEEAWIGFNRERSADKEATGTVCAVCAGFGWIEDENRNAKACRCEAGAPIRKTLVKMGKEFRVSDDRWDTLQILATSTTFAPKSAPAPNPGQPTSFLEHSLPREDSEVPF
jgi:hypothetical protein